MRSAEWQANQNLCTLAVNSFSSNCRLTIVRAASSDTADWNRERVIVRLEMFLNCSPRVATLRGDQLDQGHRSNEVNQDSSKAHWLSRADFACLASQALIRPQAFSLRRRSLYHRPDTSLPVLMPGDATVNLARLVKSLFSNSTALDGV
jgi:hypothetical protein